MSVLSSSLEAIGDGVRRVVDYTEDVAAAAVELAELWDAPVVHDTVQASFRCQDVAQELTAALVRLHEAAG